MLYFQRPILAEIMINFNNLEKTSWVNPKGCGICQVPTQVGRVPHRSIQDSGWASPSEKAQQCEQQTLSWPLKAISQYFPKGRVPENFPLLLFILRETIYYGGSLFLINSFGIRFEFKSQLLCFLSRWILVKLFIFWVPVPTYVKGSNNTP